MGAWDSQHGALDEPLLYGSTTYEIAAALLADCLLVEDWGCGGGGFKHYRADGYVGVDSSLSPCRDVEADLGDYRTVTPGILIRHVLEHNDRWPLILANALASFTQRLVIVLFTPFDTVETTVLLREPDYGNVPVISFRPGDLLDIIFAADPTSVAIQRVESPDTAYGVEHVIVVDR